MNLGSEERWGVLRVLHEVHAIPLEMLATATGKNRSTIDNRAIREGWTVGGQGMFDLNASSSLVSRLAAVTRQQLEQLSNNGEISVASEKQLRMFSTLVSSINKFEQMSVKIGQDSDTGRSQKCGKEGDEAGHAGEDILALRASVETFIGTLGEEEADPQFSGEIE